MIAAATGREAVALCQTRDVEVLFTDCVMPGEIDGPGLAACLTERHASLAVLFTFGHRQAADPLPTGGAQFLPKPYTASQLAEALGRSLGS